MRANNRKKLAATLFGAISGALLTATPLSACTGFLVADDNVVLFGNNEDFFNPDILMWFVPGGGSYYGSVCFGYDDFYPQGGMNEKGLVFDGFATAPLPITASLNKPWFKGNLVAESLATCATVEEVIELFQRYNLAFMDRCMFMFADRSGGAVIIEGDEFIRKEGKFQIITNFYQSQYPLEAPCPRYRTAHEMLSAADEFSVDLCRRVLDAVHAEHVSHTLYSNIYDLKRGIVYLYHFHDFDHPVVINLAEELTKGSRHIEIPSLFPDKPEWERVARDLVAAKQRRRNRLPVIELEPAALQACVGVYESAEGDDADSRLTVVFEGDKLYEQFVGGQRRELLATSPTEFYAPDYFLDLEFSFARQGEGPAEAVDVTIAATQARLTRAPDPAPEQKPLQTRWAREVEPDNVHAEYPRPQMARADWQNLNGLWEYAITPKEAARPDGFAGEILVPFPIESQLSRVAKRVNAEKRLWYRRSFRVPLTWRDRRILLNFGAVDFEATVWVNGKEVGSHRGGYDPFTFDISDALNPPGAQELLVSVWDPTSAGTQPRGKQVEQPGGIWYTPTTGIWQTVWLEPVGTPYISSLRIVPDVDTSSVRVRVNVEPPEAKRVTVEATVRSGIRVLGCVTGKPGGDLELKITKPRLWSPDDPFLYDLEVSLEQEGVKESRVLDRVETYFGLRQVSIGRDKQGVTRIMLNGEPCFMLGLLDQGFWPDGLYTAPTDEALRYDIEMTKRLGFNLARKHVKVEPQRWYYWCDKLGLLVWQDMPSGDQSPGQGEREIKRSKESAAQFELELQRLIDAFYNHPSIVMWVPFNESWGQYDTVRIAQWVKQHDPTRLVNSVSGWHDFGVGDVHDIHAYPGPASPDPEPARAAVLGEFGGLGLPLSGHTWQDEKNWGYRSYGSQEELTDAYLDLLARLRLFKASPGLSAAVYTQTTDVEIEVNGLMTYDRAVVKVDAEKVAAANRKLYEPPPVIETIVPTSQQQGHIWRYTTAQPAEDWMAPSFDASTWKEGPAGFGKDGTPRRGGAHGLAHLGHLAPPRG